MPGRSGGDRYEFEGALGKGGIAAVFKARSRSSGRRVALKRLLDQTRMSHAALFEREYRTLHGLSHPNIVRVFDYGKDEHGPFYTMELLEGSEVAELAPLPWPEVCRVLRDTASGLALLHARRLVHRDVSARNVWRLNDGNIKLIDFGALSPFGTVRDVVGTAPFIAPEVLRSHTLDQRTDLFSLGALGYYLLTGMHAYPAGSVAELNEAWAAPPCRVSELVAALERSDLPAVPAALDTLLSALLGLDPMSRPNSAGEVIDRLCAIAELPSAEHESGVAEAYLLSKEFSGRRAQRAQFRRQANAASEQRGSVMFIEAPARLGRSRLLHELMLDASLGASAVLQVQGRAEDDFHTLAEALAGELLQALPGEARRTAEPLHPWLGQVSASMRALLGVRSDKLAGMPQAPSEGSLRIQNAMRDWLLEVSKQRAVTLLVDDVHLLDERSLSFLASLAGGLRERRLLLVCTSLGQAAQKSDALRELRAESECCVLQPLDAGESLDLLRSVFGEVPHLYGFADRLFERAEGNPGQIMDLAEHLVREGLVRYADGTWQLPQLIAPDKLPLAPLAVMEARLARLDEAARELAQRLSLPDGELPMSLCSALSDLPPAALFAALELLVREGVLTGAGSGYRFTRGELRTLLRAELPETARARAHLRTGQALLQQAQLNITERLEAGVHLLQGGDLELGMRTVSRAATRAAEITLDGPELGDVTRAVVALESALVIYKQAGRSDHEQIALLAPLVIAGFYGDFGSATRHGDDAVLRLERVLMLPLAVRLRRYLGATLSLVVAFVVAASGLLLRSRRQQVPSFVAALSMLIKTIAALNSIGGICLDRARVLRYTKVMEPLTGLGSQHAASVMYAQFRAVERLTVDHYAPALDAWRAMLARFEDPAPIRDMPDEVRAANLATCCYVVGALEALGENPLALQSADRLQTMGFALFDMGAEQVRAMYHAVSGDLAGYELFRKRLQRFAIERGSAWQAEVWAACTMSYVHLRTRDAMRMKQDLATLERLNQDIPSLSDFTRRARGVYRLLRGDPKGAIEQLSPLAEQPINAFWSRDLTALARAHNQLGQHERARALCLHTLTQMHPDDARFPIEISTKIELALAEAALGEHERARTLLEALLACHGALGALTLGNIHEAAARAALLAHDEARFDHHLREMEQRYRALAIPSLIEVCDALSVVSAGTAQGDQAQRSRSQLYAHRIRHGLDQGASSTDQARWLLTMVSEYAALDEAYLFVVRGSEVSCSAQRGGDAAHELADWAQRRTVALCEAEDETSELTDQVTGQSPNCLQHAGRTFRLHPLKSGGQVFGALLLPAGIACPLQEVLLGVSQRLVSSIGPRSLARSLAAHGSEASGPP